MSGKGVAIAHFVGEFFTVIELVGVSEDLTVGDGVGGAVPKVMVIVEVGMVPDRVVMSGVG